VILRLVSNADLASQTYSGGKDALGFAVLSLTKKADARNVSNAQLNKVLFFANVGTAKFDHVGSIDIDRTATLKPHDAENPIQKIYNW